MEKEENDKKRSEWQLAARIFNRVFMVIYILTVLVTLSVIYLQLPQLVEQHSGVSFDSYTNNNYFKRERIEIHKT